ncbi:S1C family serine protease [Streptomyces sp. BI20]|uniref:S1C family serine protease n=1 Tax=Streptomyces sp. BI20 TaxID=3403460 RepID=UPI003C77ED41
MSDTRPTEPAPGPTEPGPTEPASAGSDGRIPPPRVAGFDPPAPAALPRAPFQVVDHGPADTARRGPRTLTLIGLGLGVALVAGGLGGWIGVLAERRAGASVVLPQAGPEDRGRAPESVAGIAERALPGVVTLHVSGGDGDGGGTGTGFVLDSRGHILTNHHVVAGATRMYVTFGSGESVPARLVGGDTGYDLAVVRVEGVRNLSPLALGNSENVRVGDPVVAIGAPFDLSNTVTAGIISATGRPITAGGEKGDGSDISYVDALQTDAPINPGNSGGPLLDSKARVIGVNSAIRGPEDTGNQGEEGRGRADGGPSRQTGSIGLGFAIPVNQAKRVAEELIRTGRATHPVIGVTLDLSWAGDGARVGGDGGEGKPAVVPDGPADRAGIRAGDVITKVDGARVRGGDELIVKIRAHRPGDSLTLTYERDGRARTTELVLGTANGS